MRPPAGQSTNSTLVTHAGASTGSWSHARTLAPGGERARPAGANGGAPSRALHRCVDRRGDRGRRVSAVASGGHTFDDFTLPGTESQAALDLLESRFPAQSGATATVVLHAPTGTLETPGGRSRDRRRRRRAAAALPQDPTVSGPVPSKSPSITLVNVQYSQTTAELGVPAFQALEDATAAGDRGRAARSRSAGRSPTSPESPKSSASDLVGLLVAIVILVFAFGSILAAGLPIGTALLGLAVGLSGIRSSRRSPTSAARRPSSAR